MAGSPAPGNPLDRDSIAGLVQGSPPLVEEYVSLEQQLQPNGFDFTLREVGKLVSAGSMGAASVQREVSATETLSFGEGGWLSLAPGPYLITFNEMVTLPLDLMALARPRSSLLRCGVSVHTAVWDAGYHGRSEALLLVHHPLGYRLQRDARLVQLIFFRLPRVVSQGYQGRFQGENLR
jgi:dUTP pyrophosphatase